MQSTLWSIAMRYIYHIEDQPEIFALFAGRNNLLWFLLLFLFEFEGSQGLIVHVDMRAQKELGESGKNIHFWAEDASTPAGEFKNQKPKNV